MAFPFCLLLFITPIQGKKAANLNILPFCAHISNSPYTAIYYFFLREGLSPPSNNAITIHTPINDVANRLSVHPWLI